MKRDIRLETLGFRLRTSVPVAALLFLAFSSPALTENNPYASISGRNTFALKPPVVPSIIPVVAPTPAPTVSLQGISTILGRAQALLKVKIAPKPPEAAKDLFLVMDVGQREGDVEVVSIDPTEGSVKLNNQGSIVTLNIKDADKPIAGPAIPSAPIASIGGLPNASPIPTPGAGASVATPSGIPNSAMPSRSIRPTPTPSAIPVASQLPGQAKPVRELSVEEGAILLEVNRKMNEGKGLPFPPPRVKLD